MKPLTLETLQEIVARETAVVRFPGHDVEVTVRQLTAAEGKRIQDAVGTDDTPAANQNAELLMASIGITTADYDSDEGRAALQKLPRPMIAKIAGAIFGLTGADGETSKN
jgi:hypothetical protein